jgi:multicomponent Na+:H+ antiporter subunit B
VVTPGPEDQVPDPLVRVAARLLLGPSVVLAAGLIAKGYAEVGDGFGAGVIVALAVALTYVALGREDAEAALPVLRLAPTVAVVGLLVALGSGFFPLLLGEPPVTHRPGPGGDVVKIGALELITPVLLDVGIFLLVVGLLTVLLHQLASPDEEADR